MSEPRPLPKLAVEYRAIDQYGHVAYHGRRRRPAEDAVRHGHHRLEVRLVTEWHQLPVPSPADTDASG